MKKLLYLSPLLLLFSCVQKEPTQADFMNRALKSDDYKVVSTNFQRVKDSLAKKKVTDTAAVIYEYNTIAGNSLPQSKTMAQVVTQVGAMTKDSTFLKSVQTGLAARLAKAHQDSVSKK